MVLFHVQHSQAHSDRGHRHTSLRDLCYNLYLLFPKNHGHITLNKKQMDKSYECGSRALDLNSNDNRHDNISKTTPFRPPEQTKIRMSAR